MKRIQIAILLAVIALLMSSLACNALANGVSVTTANITRVHMATDENDSQSTKSYSPDVSSFYCFFDLNNAPDDTKVKGVWTAVDAKGIDPNFLIDSSEITHGDGVIYFSLERSSDAWPVGKYKVELFVNDKLVQTVNFEVR